MNVIFSVCPYKNHFYAKAAVFIIICFRQTGSPSPGINHVSVSFFACEIKNLCKTLIYKMITCKAENMIVQTVYSRRYHCGFQFICSRLDIQFCISAVHKTEGSAPLYRIPFLASILQSSPDTESLSCFQRCKDLAGKRWRIKNTVCLIHGAHRIVSAQTDHCIFFQISVVTFFVNLHTHIEPVVSRSIFFNGTDHHTCASWNQFFHNGSMIICRSPEHCAGNSYCACIVSIVSAQIRDCLCTRKISFLSFCIFYTIPGSALIGHGNRCKKMSSF